MDPGPILPRSPRVLTEASRPSQRPTIAPWPRPRPPSRVRSLVTCVREMQQGRTRLQGRWGSLALVSHILAGAPASTTTGEGTVFLNEMAANKLDRFEQRRQLKDLPLANALALFMVAKAESDVVAVFLHFPNFGRCRVIVACASFLFRTAALLIRSLSFVRSIWAVLHGRWPLFFAVCFLLYDI
jgi:hypothetical protein